MPERLITRPSLEADGFNMDAEFGPGPAKTLYRMLNGPDVIYHAELVIPASVFLFGKHDFGKTIEDNVRDNLRASINFNLEYAHGLHQIQVREEDPTSKLAAALESPASEGYVWAGMNISAYLQAFGEFPLEEADQQGILEKLSKRIRKHLSKNLPIPAARTAKGYLILGGERFWSKIEHVMILEELYRAFREHLAEYRKMKRFDWLLEEVAVSYRVLKGTVEQV